MAEKDRTKQLLERAAALSPEKREEYLARECRGDAALRREVEELLAAGENSPYLEQSFAFRGNEDETLPLVLAGQYRIRDKLGAGAMGQVYLADDEKIPRQVAIKFFEEGYAKEVEALGRIRSDHVVKIFNVGDTESGRPFMVMEFLTGETLADLLKRRGLLPKAEIAQLMGKICAAATELHETKLDAQGRGIVHRDLKPSNIMVEKRRGNWEVKLFDFGVARMENPLMAKSTSKHKPIGTPMYMSPEQFHGEGMAAFGCRRRSRKDIISPATDIYSLGVIAYEMLLARHPFRDSASAANVAAMQREVGYEKALKDRRDIPAAAQQAVLKAMAFCPERRYQKAEEFGGQLEEALLAVSPQRKYATAAALALAAALICVGVYVWYQSGLSTMPHSAGSVTNSNQIGSKGDPGKPTPANSLTNNEPSPTAAEREVTYWMETQSVKNQQPSGRPRTITVDDELVSGSGFRVYFTGKERGYLYLINDGPSPNGRSLQVLFPIPYDPARKEQRNDGTSEVSAGKTVKAFESIVGASAGVEHLWIVWSVDRIPELEKLTQYATEKFKGRIDAAVSDSVRSFLASLKQADLTYDARKRGVLRARGNVLVKELLLRHV